jgi:hypothetical protein
MTDTAPERGVVRRYAVARQGRIAGGRRRVQNAMLPQT